MARWSEKQVLDAAPDAASVTAARKLAKPGPWSDTGFNDTLLWGKCQGSGKTPYQVSIDLVRPAYRCSCPSRKFPCKHAIALMLLWVDSDGPIGETDSAAEYAAQWQAKAEATKATRAARVEKPVDPEQQAKRLEKRLDVMDAGIEDFSRWLTDLVRTGMAAARSQPYSWWDGTASRLVDAQLPGLADQVRQLPSTLNAREDWGDASAQTLGRWWLATRAWKRRDGLDADTFADLRVVLGWHHASQDARTSSPLTDTWTVVGVHRSDDGRVQEQRTWLYGLTLGEFVLVLDFAAGTQALPIAKAAGSSLTGSVYPYPGHHPRRALLDEAVTFDERPAPLPAGGTLARARAGRARALAANPWLIRFPCVLDDAVIGTTDITDGEGATLPLAPGTDPLLALALTGSHPTRVFGELDGATFRPLSIQREADVVVVS